MKNHIKALPSVDGSLVASSISRPDKTQISIQPLHDLHELSEILTSEIDFINGESIANFRWIRQQNPDAKSVSSTPSKKRRNSVSGEAQTETSTLSNIKYFDYLVILLQTGEILIYSTFTKEFINKISTDSPFTAIDVINKVGRSKKSLYKYDYDIITFDPKDTSLKFFSSSSSQLIDSVQLSYETDSPISYILFNDEILESSDPTVTATVPELFLASNTTLYFLDNHHELIESIDISLTSASTTKKKSTTADSQGIRKIIKQKSKLLILHDDSSKVQIVDLKSKKIDNLTTSSDISDISIINANSKTPVLCATLVNGSIELFKLSNLDDSFAQLQIKGGKDIGKFVGLLNSNVIIDQVYKGIWYDNFTIQITDFEFDNINNLKGPVTIALGDSENDDTDMFAFVSAEEGEDEDEEDDDDDDESNTAEFDVEQVLPDDDEDNDEIVDETVTDSYECENLAEFSELLKSEMKNLTLENSEEAKIAEILSQNTTFAKPTIHILSIEESNLLFSKAALIISQYPNSFHKDFATIRNVKVWLKWLLILRGSVILKNQDSVEYLKLLQSELKQESKNLNNLIKLTGKLTLLRDQLFVRDEMLKNNEDSRYDEEESESSINNGNSTSVVLDGEGGFDEDLDIDSDNNANVNDDAEEDEEL